MTMRRRFYTRITDPDGTALTTPPTVYAMKTGAMIGSAITIPASGSISVALRNPGNLRSGDSFAHWDGSTLTSGLSIAADPAFIVSVWTVTVSNANASDVVCTDGDFFVFESTSATKRLGWYNNDTSGSPSTAALTVGTYGDISFYSDAEKDCDIAVTSGGSTYYYPNLPSDARDFITPEDFGAVGNGVTDDTYAVQAAINYAEGVTGNAEVILGPKTYLTTGVTISVDNITIRGQGRRQSALRCTGQQAGITLDDCDYVTLKDFRLENTQTGATPVSAAHSGVYDVSTGAHTGHLLENLEVDGWFHGVRFGDNVTDAVLVRVYAHDNEHTGIWPGNGGTLRDCRANDNGTTYQHHGVYVDDGWDGVQIMGGEFNRNYGTGIHVYSDTTPSEDIIISDVRCIGNGVDNSTGAAAGIIVATASGVLRVRNVTISGAICKDTVNSAGQTRAGIWLDQVQGATVTAICEDNAAYGIFLLECEDVDLYGNCEGNANASSRQDAQVQLSTCTRVTSHMTTSLGGGDGVRLSTGVGCQIFGTHVNNGQTGGSTGAYAQVILDANSDSNLVMVYASCDASSARDGVALITGATGNAVAGTIVPAANTGYGLRDQGTSTDKGNNVLVSQFP